MGLFRFIVFLVLAWALMRLLRVLFTPVPPGRRPAAGPPPQAAPPPGGIRLERLVEDPVCGVRVPESRAIRDGDRFFCSEECRARFRD